MPDDAHNELRDDLDRLIRELEADGTWRVEPADPIHLSTLLNHLGTLEKRGYDSASDELAVRTAVALIAREGLHEWPPPPDLAAGLIQTIRQPYVLPAHTPANHRLRAMEFACATLLGRDVGANWPIDRSRTDWYGLARGARQIIRRFLARCIDRCLKMLSRENRRGGVPGMPYLDYTDFVEQALNRLVGAAVHYCDCWKNARGKLHHQQQKADACIRNHHLGGWAPMQLTLWQFLQKAVQGCVGMFRQESFPSGILHDLLRLSKYELVREVVVRRRCAFCNRLTVYMRCSHVDGRYKPMDEELQLQDWLLLRCDGELQGGFVQGLYWRCVQGHIVETATTLCPRCGQGKKPRSRDIPAYSIPEQPEPWRHQPPTYRKKATDDETKADTY